SFVAIRPLMSAHAQRVSSNMARSIRHYPPVNFDSCSMAWPNMSCDGCFSPKRETIGAGYAIRLLGGCVCWMERAGQVGTRTGAQSLHKPYRGSTVLN